MRSLRIHIQPLRIEDREPAGLIDHGAVARAFDGLLAARLHLEPAIRSEPSGSGMVGEEALLDALRAFRARSRLGFDGPDYLGFVVVAGSLSEYSLAHGVLFGEESGIGFRRREGCGVFWEAMPRGREALSRLLTRTVVHELGHLLNLDHADAEPGTVMTHVAPEDAAPPYSFADIGRRHIAGHEDDYVRPGSMRFFGSVESGQGHRPREYSPYAGPVSRVRAKLELHVATGPTRQLRKRSRAHVSDVLVLRTRVRNERKRPLLIPIDGRGGLRVRS